MSDVTDENEKPTRRAAPKAKAEAAPVVPTPQAAPVPESPTVSAPTIASPAVPTLNLLENIMNTTQDFSRFFPQYDKVIAFHKSNVEALVQTNTLLAKSAQEISKEYFAQAQEHLQDAASAGQAVLKAKTLQDAVQLNVDTAKAGFEKLVATSTKLGELSTKLVTEALAPVKARMEVAVSSLTTKAA